MRDNDGNPVYVFAGSYGSAGQEGIHLLTLDREAGTWERIGGAAGVENPSFLALHPNGEWLYAVSETNGGAVVSFSFDLESAAFQERNRQPSEGDAPCHLHVDRTGRWLLAVNYTSGSVCLYPIEPTGQIGPIADFIRHEGQGPRADRQEGPHAHSAFPIPGTDDWVVSDLGTDGLYVYRLDAEAGKLVLRCRTSEQPGAGPRHAAFHPKQPILYVIEELSCEVAVYRYDSARTDKPLEQLQRLSTLPDGFSGENTCADIHLTASGRYLYGSNRGHDSVAVFRVTDEGLLEANGHASTLGRTPRNFAVLGDEWLLAANQDSDEVQSLRIGPDGVPAASGRSIRLAKPVCLQIVSAK
ncbi:lactonase family protein [Cohnella zeiphila]|uniref:Lactonase family protein n=1 Tax=Cohnella zeiphila TaxID=2761120 RepID=A0A7X0ST37_9BACL|nr:lactonase family protein [Cohnella zeiphila]MBB6735620.1 lactonase family protein [Cohnella zeiphila]